jgi:peptide/nickel transport system permease protein
MRRAVKSKFLSASILIGGTLLALVLLFAIVGPLIAWHDPLEIDPISRLKPPSSEFLMGTDSLGRDVFSRVATGAKVSLIVGALVAFFAIAIGAVVGLLSGFFPAVDKVIMRFMDGMMAIPAIVLAVALVALSGSGLATVVVAITLPEIPRTVRLVRGLVLSLREEAFVEAAIGVGTRWPTLLVRHLFPNCIPPLIVQGTYCAAAAIILEAILSFLGAGFPPEVPTWGNIVASGRGVFQLAPWVVLFPGVLIALTVLAVNILGDGLRDRVDPKLSKRL